MEDIKQWLNGGKPYQPGVALLVKYSSNERLKRLFTTEAESPFKVKKMLETLRGFLQENKQAAPDKPQATQNPKPETPNAPPPNPWEGKDTNEVLAALHAQWLPLFAELKNLQARVYDISKAGDKDSFKKEEAGKMAHRILDLDDACEAIYKKRDHYLAHGVLPGEELADKKLVVDPNKFPLALSNAQRYVREFKLKVKAKPENEKAAAKLKHWEGMVEYYKNKLNLC